MNREDAEKKIIELAQWRCTTKLCEGRISCYKCKEDRLEEAMKVIEAIQERPKGRWVHEGRRIKHGVDWYKCSQCEMPVSGVQIEYDYCPNCGVYMKGE